MMPFRTPSEVRLGRHGVTIFTVMSALAAQHDAVNLGQGFPDFDCDRGLVEAAHQAMLSGLNQYPPMAGVAALRQAIGDKIARLHGRQYDPDSEITVTAGATHAISTALLAFVQSGDEVIVLEPAYDSYVPAIELAGATAVPVRMRAPQETGGNFSVDWARVKAAITPRTRMLIINTPHNPSGAILSREDMLALGALLDGTDILVLSDEVYEHMVYDGRGHESIARFPELAQRSILVSSFGKTYHITGWKIGYVAAPAGLMNLFRKIHQFNMFAVHAPAQHALAAWLGDARRYMELPGFYQQKRDAFRAGLASSKLRLLPCSGTYYQLVDYGNVSDLPEARFCEWLTREVGVAAIPVSAFYQSPVENRVVRFCFAKQPATLERALERLVRL